MPLIDIKIPANAAIMFNIFMQIAAFDLIKIDDWLGEAFGLPNTDPLTLNFKHMGMD